MNVVLPKYSNSSQSFADSSEVIIENIRKKAMSNF